MGIHMHTHEWALMLCIKHARKYCHWNSWQLQLFWNNLKRKHAAKHEQDWFSRVGRGWSGGWASPWESQLLTKQGSPLYLKTKKASKMTKTISQESISLQPPVLPLPFIRSETASLRTYECQHCRDSELLYTLFSICIQKEKPSIHFPLSFFEWIRKMNTNWKFSVVDIRVQLSCYHWWYSAVCTFHMFHMTWRPVKLFPVMIFFQGHCCYLECVCVPIHWSHCG